MARPCVRCGQMLSTYVQEFLPLACPDGMPGSGCCTACQEAIIVRWTWQVVMSGLPRGGPVPAVVDTILLFLGSPKRLERIWNLHRFLLGPAYTYSPFHEINREYDRSLYQSIVRGKVVCRNPKTIEVRTYFAGARWLTTSETLTTLILYYLVPEPLETFKRCSCSLAQHLATDQLNRCAHCNHRWWRRSHELLATCSSAAHQLWWRRISRM